MATAPRSALLGQIHRLTARRGGRPGTDRELLEEFAARRDEAAFAALVGRHGPMVLRVCRRVLRHEQDAEDAFQATFLVLARSTASIRKREALASWLHGVAHRTALKAKRSAARRRDHEGRRPAQRPAAPGPTWDEVQAALDEEIQALPERYRTAFVLCVLEGKSRPEAAAELGVKEGTVWSRLTRARQLLQGRLTRRGIKLSALLAALSLVESAAATGVPAGLARATV
jgi:RNA polymerase sigma factor (sigma-70 family)